MKNYKLEFYNNGCEIGHEYKEFECYALAADYARSRVWGDVTSVMLRSGDDWEYSELFF